MKRKKLIYENKNFIFDHPKERSIKLIIKELLYPFINLYYKVLFSFIKVKKSCEKKYKVAICAIFRDEARTLKEWIEYHLIVGVEHFYLYNNFSEDNYLEIVNPYIEKGIITLVDWPYTKAQMQAYEHCVENYKDESQWIGFVDLDEFVVPNKQFDTIFQFLKKFNNRPLVVIYWKYFGSSGLIDRNRNNLVCEDFTKCWYKFADIGKYFFNTDYDYETKEKYEKGMMHWRWCSYKKSCLPPVNIFNNVILFGINKIKKDMPIQINHYLLKSYREYKEIKAKRGGGVHDIQKGFHDDEYFYTHDSLCTSEDFSIYKYLIKLKLHMIDDVNFE